MAVLLNVGDEAHVLLRRPRAPVQADLSAARCSASPHDYHLTPLSLSPSLARFLICASPSSGWMDIRCREWIDPGEGQVYICARTETGSSESDAMMTSDKPSSRETLPLPLPQTIAFTKPLSQESNALWPWSSGRAIRSWLSFLADDVLQGLLTVVN